VSRVLQALGSISNGVSWNLVISKDLSIHRCFVNHFWQQTVLIELLSLSK